MSMSRIVKFKTSEARDQWIARHGHTHQITEVFINQPTLAAPGYALEVRKLVEPGMPR